MEFMTLAEMQAKAAELGLPPIPIAVAKPIVVSPVKPKSVTEELSETASFTDEKKEQIQKLETSIQELQEELGDVEVSLQPVPDDLDAKIEVLKANELTLRDALTEPSELPSKPKFGKFDGPIVMIRVVGRPDPVWVDVDGVNVDDGTQVKMTSDLQGIIDAERARRAAEGIKKYDAPFEGYKQYAMTKEQYEAEIEKEYPVCPLLPQPGPKWKDSILYGLSGNIIRKASQHCESHPAGMLVDFLVSIGSIIGRGPYFNIGATRHYTNEFMCRVGDSSKSRKGTGRDAIDSILKLADPAWYSERIESGFGSGEAIINRVRDTTQERRQTKAGAFEFISVPGIDDKRLCIREGELASVFVLAGKPESRADIVIRDGWDGKTLRNIVKGKSREGFSNSAKCEEPHLSISGDTTIHELRAKMPDGADENGFGNRFIYVYVYRVKDCPQGGPDLDWSKEIVELREAIEIAKSIKHMAMSNAARKWWNKHYAEIEGDGLEGLAGKMTTRGASHIRRLAMIYALLDQAEEINLDHFHAAKALWDYCEESASFIFGGVTTEQLRILNWIGLRGPATYKQIYAELYQKHKLVGEIKADLAALTAKKKLALRSEVYFKPGENQG